MTEKPFKTWSGEFGKEYTERNECSLEEHDELFYNRYGVNRQEVYGEMLSGIDRDTTILEVGVNTGRQLSIFENMGFSNLYGVDLLRTALRKGRYPPYSVQGDARDLPFEDDAFDLVYTKGVLIHIPSKFLDSVLTEISRCAKRYVLGFEYFSDSREKIKYRGHDDLLWKDIVVDETSLVFRFTSRLRG